MSQKPFNSDGGFSTTGNITGNYFVGNGSQLTGLPASYGNANVANFMGNYGSNTISMTGTITSGNVFVNGEVSTTGNVIGANVIGYSFYANGIISASGNIDAPQFHGSVFGNTVSNITITPDTHFAINVGNVANVVYINDGGMIVDGGVSGFISASGNISGANIGATNDITGGNILTGGKVSAVGAVFGANAIIENFVSANRVGANIFEGGIVSVGGNITSNSWVNAQYMGSHGNIRIYSGNLIVQSGYVSAVGNVIGGNIVTAGTGGNITLTGGNIDGANIISANTFVSNAFNVVTAGNLFINSQYGLGTVGTILEQDGLLELVANGTGGCVLVGWNSSYGNGLGNVAQIYFNRVGGGEGNAIVTTGNIAGTSYEWNFDSTGNLGLPGGGIIYGNPYTPSGAPGNTITLQPAGSGVITDQRLLVYPTAADGDHIHLTSGNLYQTELFLGSDNLYVKLANTGNVVINSNDNVGNTAQWTFGADGNLTLPSNTFAVNYANGTAVSIGGAGSYGNANVADYLPTYTGNLANLGGDVNTSGNVSASGNVTAGGGAYFIGDGSLLTNLPSGSYGNANVATFLAAYGSNTVSTTGNITSGNLLTTGLFSATGNVLAGGNVNLVGNLSNINFSTGAYITGNAVGREGSISLQPYTGAGSTFPGVLIGGAGRILAPNGSAHLVLNSSDFTVQVAQKITTGTVANSTTTGALQVSGGVGVTGNLYVGGNTTTGNNAIVAGVTGTLLANSTASFFANVNSYTQITYQNRSTGADATADFILTADNGNDTVNYSDFGIINSGYDNSTPTNSLGNIVFAADTYLYAQGNVSNTSQAGGNLAIGTTTAGKTVKIFAGGVTSNAIVANISNTGIAVTGSVSASGNITAQNFIGNISLTGNVTGTSSNVTLVAGSYSWSFNNAGNLVLPGNTFAVNYANGTAVSLGGSSYGNSNVSAFLGAYGSNTISTTGNITSGNLLTSGVVSAAGFVKGVELTSTNSTGSEGGQINLSVPAANTTLGGTTVTVDVYQNQFRIFEGSANAKGAYIDLANCANGVGTNLVNRASIIAGANTAVTLDNLQARVGGSPTRLYINTVSGNLTGAGDSQTMTSGSMAVASWINVPIGQGAANAFAMSGALSSNGDTAILSLIDQGSGTGMWRITGMIANTTANLYGVTIERLV